jgi:phosphoglycolate/pyridoxal phosphate phosphatase family enzyme
MEEMKRLEEYYDLWNQKNPEPKKMPVLFQSREQVSQYVDSQFDTIIFDCDGVLYRGKHLIPEAAQTLQSLVKKKNVLFVTNNAGSNRHQLCEKLSDMLNCPSIRIDQIISSSYSCANYLQHRHHLLPSISSSDNLGNHKQIKHVFVVGTEGLCDELRAAGLSTVSVPDTEPHSMSRDELAVHDFEGLYFANQDVDAVVVGLDTEFSYRKLCVATVLLQKFPNAPLVATNRDAFDLVGHDGRRLPGNGSLVAALECASQRTAIHVGKPSDHLGHVVLHHTIGQEKMGGSSDNDDDSCCLDPARTLFIGDRLDTDIAFALSLGMSAALVLTGCTTVSQLIQEQDKYDSDDPTISTSSILPTVVFPHMGLMA